MIHEGPNKNGYTTNHLLLDNITVYLTNKSIKKYLQLKDFQDRKLSPLYTGLR